MLKVKAKMVCSSVEELVQQEEKMVKLRAVVSGSEENKSFSRWTPTANLEMIISNETSAGDYFEPGKEYYLTFEKAE